MQYISKAESLEGSFTKYYINLSNGADYVGDYLLTEDPINHKQLSFFLYL